MTNNSWKLLAVAAFLSACSTVPNPEQEVREKAWVQVTNHTDAVAMGSNRVRVEASTPFASRVHDMEANLLLRAAGEAMNNGADRFAIVYLDYDDSSMNPLSIPDFDDPSTRWIGSYEQMLAARSDSDFDGSLKDSFGFKNVTAVIRLFKPGEDVLRETFPAEETYEVMLKNRIDRRNIKPSKRLDLPFF